MRGLAPVDDAFQDGIAPGAQGLARHGLPGLELARGIAGGRHQKGVAPAAIGQGVPGGTVPGLELGGQLLQERLALLAVACWLQNLARRNGMFLLPMLFMLLVTLSALVLGIVAQGRALLAGTGGAVAALQLVIAVLLLALSLVLVHEGWQALRRKGRPAAEKA